MGNRDINKIRILQEIGIATADDENEKPNENDSCENLPMHGGYFKFQGKRQQGDPDLIRKCSDEIMQSKKCQSTSIDENNILVPNSSGERLKWILRKTMGSPNAFEWRRLELQQEKDFYAFTVGIQNEAETLVTDGEVVDSYRKSCHPNGEMGNYIKRANLSLKLGGAMFMHGSLPLTPELVSMFRDTNKKSSEINMEGESSFWDEFYKYALPFVGEGKSGMDLPSVRNAQEWSDALNEFARYQYDVWHRNITTVEEGDNSSLGLWSTTGGYQNASDGAGDIGSLCQYGMDVLPSGEHNPSIVYQSWMQDGYPKFFRKQESREAYQNIVKQFFDINNLDVIVSGHQPVGDLPFPIQISANKFIICADTSYSRDTIWLNNRENTGKGESISFRGDAAVSEVLLKQWVGSGKIYSVGSHGVLSDGTAYDSDNLYGSDEGNAMIGTLVDRKKLVFEEFVQDDSNDEVDWFVRSKLEDGSFLISSGRGIEVFNSIATKR